MNDALLLLPLTLLAEIAANNKYIYLFFTLQSEPLYVPVKFQDVPAERSNCLIEDCDSGEYSWSFLVSMLKFYQMWLIIKNQTAEGSGEL